MAQSANYTGCLSNGGALNKIAIGEQPAKPCSDDQTQVSWDRAGPAFDERIAALEARIAELEERVAEQTVGAPSPVRLFAAATVDVTNIQSSVGPLESVTSLGTADYRVAFSEDVFGDIAPRTTAFISLASNSFYHNPSPCTYEVLDSRTLNVLCWDETTGEPEDAEWSLMVFSANVAPPNP